MAVTWPKPLKMDSRITEAKSCMQAVMAVSWPKPLKTDSRTTEDSAEVQGAEVRVWTKAPILGQQLSSLSSLAET